MGSILNIPPAGQRGNTGVDPKNIPTINTIGIFFADPGFKIAASALTDKAATIAALQAAALAPVGQRIYPIHNIVQIADNTEDSVNQKFNNGSTNKVRSGFWGATYQILTGGGPLFANILNNFDGQPQSFLRYDSNGTLKGTTNTAGDLVFVNTDNFDAKTVKENDGTKEDEFAFMISANPAFFKLPGNVYKLALGDLLGIKGLTNATIAQNGARRTGGVVDLNLSAFNVDLHVLYASNFAASSLWKAQDAVTGNNVPVSTVVDKPSINGWTLTVDTADPNYNSGNKLLISLSIPSIINTAIPALFIESNVLTTLT